MLRLLLLFVLVVAVAAGVAVASVAALGWTPFARYVPGRYAIWIGVEHGVGPATARPVARASHGVSGAGAFVGRGWRTQRQADGTYTLTAFDGAFVPL